MKNIFKNTFRHSMLRVAIVTSSLFLSCDSTLDVDEDFDSPTTAPVNQLLTHIEFSIKDIGDFNNFGGDIYSVYTHQFSSRQDYDQYNTKSNSIIISNDWNTTYLTLTNIETLISKGTEDNNMVYVGITQLLKAYLMSSAVDIWGDVPFSEATQLESGIISPVFDDQQAIYQSVLALIDTAKLNISGGLGSTPGNDDLFYAGDTDKWIKFANTFKFKLYNQIRTTSLFNQADFTALVNENNFFTSALDDFEFKQYVAQAPLDERNQLFLGAYGGTQVSFYLSPWFYEILKGWNPNIHTGNMDPRIPYYFVNQLLPGQLPPDQGNAETGDPSADYWDADSGFFSIRFGSIGPNRDHAVQNSATFPGIFATGGFYDDGSGPTITSTSGTGQAPRRILTYDEFLYIQAELIHAGVLTGAGSVEDKLQAAMVASFKKVDLVVAGTGTSQDVPVLTGSDEVADFIDNVMDEFSDASDEKKLEIIMTQKWVATFGDSMDQYSDYRRTGYPVLANPNGPSPEYQLDNGDGFPLDDSFTVLNNAFQISFFWPATEININKNSPSQKNPTTYSIFWDN